MAEQYIYSRSERGFTNARGQAVPLGFGYVASSPGLSKACRQDAAMHCEDCPCPVQRDRDGRRVPLLRKVRLSKGQVLLQKSGWIEGNGRDFHVAHGYVLEDGEAKAAGPGGWLTAGFRLDDPNQVEGGVLLDSVPGLAGADPVGFGRLKDAAAVLGLDRGQFCQLLLACFDGLASRRLVLLAHDFRRPEEWKQRQAILYWIYTCLPYDLWTGLGFDSVYTEKTIPKLVQLAFVDREQLQMGPVPSIQQGNQSVSLGGGFLVAEGRLIHKDSQYKTAWYGKEGIYADWLGRLVDAAWDCSGEEMPALVSELDRLREGLQLGLDALPEKARLEPGSYAAACEGCGGHGAGKSDSGEEAGAADTGAAVETTENAALVRTLLGLLRRERQPASDEDIQTLSDMVDTPKRAWALGMLGAFAAIEAENASLTAVLRRYQALLPPRVYAVLPYRLLWGGLDQVEQAIWLSFDVKTDTGAARQRRLKWYVETSDAYDGSCSQADYGKRMVGGLPGISGVYREWMEEELQSLFNARTAHGI